MNETSLTDRSASAARLGELRPDSPCVLVFPPALYLATFLAGVLLNLLWPMRLAEALWPRIAGVILALACVPFAIWARTTMVRAGTNVIPNKPTLTIVTGGPFRFTRNPLYLSNACFFLGLTLIFNLGWSLFLFLPMVIVIHWGIIRREERYLEVKFGETYLNYKRRVRRWL